MKDKKRLLTLFIAFCYASDFVFASQTTEGLNPKYAISELTMDHWTYRNGLSSNNINTVYQTEDDFIWITSYNGIQRFDGVEFEKFNAHSVPGFNTGSTYKIFEDGDEQTWITTKGSGLVGYSKGNFFHYADNDLIPQAVICMIESSIGDVWIGTDNSGVFLKKNEDSIKRFEAIPETRILEIMEDSNNNIWVGTQSKGLYKISGEQISHYGLKEGLPNEAILNIYEAFNGDIYIGTAGGLAIFKNGKIIKKPLLDGHEINAVILDNYGTLWIATGSGLIRENEELGIFELFSKEQGLPGIRVTTLCFDHEGSLWVGTYNSGLIRFRLGQITNLTTKEGLSFNKVNAIGEYRGLYYVGTEDGEVNIYDGNSFQQYQTNLGPHRPGIRDFLFDNNGAMWVGSYDGISYYPEVANPRKTFKLALPSQEVRRILQAKDETIWIGTRSGGLIKYDKNGDHIIYNKENGLGSDYILSVEEDLNGNIIVGTNAGGLSIIDASGKSETKNVINDDSGLIIFNTHIDTSNGIWLCTNIGLLLYKDDEFLKIKFDGTLQTEKFFDLIEDGIGGVWLTTDYGIIRVEKQQLSNVAGGVQETIQPQIYNELDGMVTRECTGATRSFLDPKTGNIWVPTFEGIVIIDPQVNLVNDRIPKIFITAATADNNSMNIHNEEIKIEPGSFRYSFRFASLSYLAPARIQFKYMLEGIDNEWKVLTGKRNVEYTNLKPGSYNLKVKGSNGHGIWNEQGASLSFEVLPFFYETIWFYFVIVLSVSLVLWMLYKWRVNVIQKNNKALTKINKELDNFVYRASHDLRAPVTSTIGLVDIALKERSSEEKDAYFRMVDQCAHKLDHIIHDMIEYSMNKNKRINHSRFSMDTLINDVLYELKYMDHIDKVRIEKNIQTDTLYNDEFRIKIILSNLLNNAIQYANKDQKDPYVNIKVDEDKSNIQISIEDNGVGIEDNQFDKIFNMFYRGHDYSKGSGLGLYIVNETAEKLNGKVTVTSSLGKGSTFRLDIPRAS